MKKLIVFDLDGTLAPSKSSLDPEMASLLHDLLSVARVSMMILSGSVMRSRLSDKGGPGVGASFCRTLGSEAN